jgi:glycosyltransferase involved in cell wall biosynthesis
MITGRDIICISSIDWDFLWQGPQEISSRLAQAGNRVLYVENTGIRSPGLQDLGRVAHRLRRWRGSLRSKGAWQSGRNVYVCSPFVLPPFGPRWRSQLNRRLFLPMVQRAAQALGMRDPLIWTYLPTDTALNLIQMLRTPRSVVVYYKVADFAELTPHLSQLQQSENGLMEQCDLMFVACPELVAGHDSWIAKTHIFPFGVDLSAFLPGEPSTGTSKDSIHSNGTPGSVKPELDTLCKLPRPIIGYIGGIHRHIDFELLAEMARRQPNWSWVFVGAIQTGLGDLSRLRNVHLLGQQPFRDLAHFIRQFDVCIVPYRVSPFTHSVVPTKINEYLAVGKPVVATALPAVLRFNAEHRILITADAHPHCFLDAIQSALRLPQDAATVTRRREVAALGDWRMRLESMCDLIEGASAAREGALAPCSAGF